MGREIDRQALLKAVGECTTLSETQKEDLRQLISEQKKYGLCWDDIPEDAYEKMKNTIPIFTEVKNKAIVNAPNSKNHAIIEGENLHALVNLCYTHAGKIDIIYIDPPYNRGESDFMYGDDYIKSDNPFKHSLWLSFMLKRLLLSKLLLKDSGALIVHIDEHEFDALNLLLEYDVFSTKTNLGMIIWNKMNPKGDAQNVACMHEYILLFCKNKEMFAQSHENLMREKPNAQKILLKAKKLYAKLGKKSIPEDVLSVLKLYKYPHSLQKSFAVVYNFDTIQNIFKSWLRNSDFSKGEKSYKYLDKSGRVFRTVSMAWPNKKTPPEDYRIPLRHPITNELCPLPSKGWRNPSSTMKKLLGNNPPEIYADMVIKGEIAFTRKNNGKLNIPERVYYLENNLLENVPSIYNDGSSSEQLFSDMNIKFPYPKCINVAKYLLKNVVKNKNATVLDFFAGSGTTLHAVMALNKEDGGHRQCILVTNNENGICEKVTYPRNKKVIEGYTTPKGEHVEGLKDNNLRYFRMDTDSVKRDGLRSSREKLAAKMVDMLRLKHNIYTPCSAVGTLPTNPPTTRYFQDNGNGLLILLEPSRIPAMVDAIKAMEIEKIFVYVYSEGNYAYDADFAAVADKVEENALPAPFLNIFQRLALPSSARPLPVPERELTAKEAQESANEYKDPSQND